MNKVTTRNLDHKYSFRKALPLWNGALHGKGVVTTTVVLTQAVLSEAWLPAAAIIEDGLQDPVIIHDLRYSPPEQTFFPLFAAP